MHHLAYRRTLAGFQRGAAQRDVMHLARNRFAAFPAEMSDRDIGNRPLAAAQARDGLHAALHEGDEIVFQAAALGFLAGEFHPRLAVLSPCGRTLEASEAVDIQNKRRFHG